MCKDLYDSALCNKPNAARYADPDARTVTNDGRLVRTALLPGE
jgi:hypothetical protein